MLGFSAFRSGEKPLLTDVSAYYGRPNAAQGRSHKGETKNPSYESTPSTKKVGQKGEGGGSLETKNPSHESTPDNKKGRPKKGERGKS